MVFQSDSVVLKVLFSLGFDTERNWNITLPGFAGDEIKSYRKPVRILIDSFLLSIVLCSTDIIFSLCCFSWIKKCTNYLSAVFLVLNTLLFLDCIFFMVLQPVNDIHKERLAAVSFSHSFSPFFVG